MTQLELTNKLKDIYYTAKNNKATMVHLFGIIYYKELKRDNISIRDILLESGLPQSYYTEINKGINLARYVELKKEYKDEF